MNEEAVDTVNCAECSRRVCPGASYREGPENCPTKTEAGVVQEMMQRYGESPVAELARVASVVEGSAYTQVPWAASPTPQTTRLEEIIRFALMMNYRKLGLAFCVGLSNEAEVLAPLLKNCGFEVVSVCCKAGGIAKEDIGVRDEEKINPGQYESMCNPICQAEILNRKETDFNLMMGLCVGHDALFLKHCDAMTTVFAVKDRVLGHNPLAAIYTSRSYYRRLRSPDLGSGLAGRRGSRNGKS